MTTSINLAPNNLAEFDRVYQVFDADGDGTLTRSEIVEALEILGRSISSADKQNLLNRISDRGIVTRDSFLM